MPINLDKPSYPIPKPGVAYCIAPEHSYSPRGKRKPTGRSSIAISGLTPTQLAVIQAALDNVLVCQDGGLGDGAGGGKAGGSAGG